MKNVNELRNDLKVLLSECFHVNDGSLAAIVHENIQWAWENWEAKYVAPYYDGEKPEIYTPEFRDEWIDNEPFDVELEQINNPE